MIGSTIPEGNASEWQMVLSASCILRCRPSGSPVFGLTPLGEVAAVNIHPDAVAFLENTGRRERMKAFIDFGSDRKCQARIKHLIHIREGHDPGATGWYKSNTPGNHRLLHEPFFPARSSILKSR